MVIALFRDRLEIRRKSKISDGMGGFIETETPIGTARGQITHELSTTLVNDLVSQAIGNRAAYSIVLDAKRAPDIRVNDVIVDQKGKKYHVIRIGHQGRTILLIAAGE